MSLSMYLKSAIIVVATLFATNPVWSQNRPSGKVTIANHQVSSTRFDAVGILQVENPNAKEPQFVLADGSGKVKYRVSFNSGLELSSFVGKKVGLQGQSRYYPKEKVHRIRAVAVSQLNQTGNAIQLTSAQVPGARKLAPPPKTARTLKPSTTIRRVSQVKDNPLPEPVPDQRHSTVIHDEHPHAQDGDVIYEGFEPGYNGNQPYQYHNGFGPNRYRDYGPASCSGDGACGYDPGCRHGCYGRPRLFEWNCCGPLCRLLFRRQGRWKIATDALFWQPRLRSTEIGISDFDNDAVVEGSMQSLEWSGNAGGRIEIAYQFYNEWELGVTLTGYDDKSTETYAAPAGGFIRPIYDTSLTSSSVTSTGDIELGIVDVELGRYLSSHPKSTVRFFTGPRFAHYDQSLTSTYVGLGTDMASVKWDGVGARAGAEGRWFCGPCWSIFAEGSFSLLAANVDTVRSTPTYALSESFNKIIPMTEMNIGLTRHLGQCALSFSYEVTHWGDAVETLSPTQTNVSDIGFNGFFLRFGLRR